jgi:hypothetical protein
LTPPASVQTKILPGKSSNDAQLKVMIQNFLTTFFKQVFINKDFQSFAQFYPQISSAFREKLIQFFTQDEFKTKLKIALNKISMKSVNDFEVTGDLFSAKKTYTLILLLKKIKERIHISKFSIFNKEKKSES